MSDLWPICFLLLQSINIELEKLNEYLVQKKKQIFYSVAPYCAHARSMNDVHLLNNVVGKLSLGNQTVS